MKAGLRSLTLAAAVCITSMLFVPPASATVWAVSVKTGSTGEARAQAAPTAPSGVTATCVSSTQQEVTVTWGAVAKATSYTVYDATGSASNSYASIATLVSSTTWTSGSLSAGNYWFEVATYEGSTWVSAKSTVSAERTLSASGTKCT